MKQLKTPRAGLMALALSMAVAGCVPAALVGGAVGAGTLLMASDRRSGETQQADQAIEASAQEAVVRALPGRGHVNVTSYYRKALITGEVGSAQDQQAVEAVVRALPGVQGVVNELAVLPESSAVQRSNDSLITTKVRSRLINQNGVPSGSIRVLTERGTTYLMGRLTAQEATLTTEVARQTDGVQRVVRVIDIIAESGGAGGIGSVTPSSSADASAPAAAPAPSGSTGVVVQPVTQPTIVQQAPQPIQVQTLPPMK